MLLALLCLVSPLPSVTRSPFVKTNILTFLFPSPSSVSFIGEGGGGRENRGERREEEMFCNGTSSLSLPPSFLSLPSSSAAPLRLRRKDMARLSSRCIVSTNSTISQRLSWYTPASAGSDLAGFFRSNFPRFRRSRPSRHPPCPCALLLLLRRHSSCPPATIRLPSYSVLPLAAP